MGGAGVERKKGQRQGLRDHPQSHTDSIRPAEQSHSRKIRHPGKDENIELKRELTKHHAAAQRQCRKDERFPDRHAEVERYAGAKA